MFSFEQPYCTLWYVFNWRGTKARLELQLGQDDPGVYNMMDWLVALFEDYAWEIYFSKAQGGVHILPLPSFFCRCLVWAAWR